MLTTGECLELANRLLQQFPKQRSRESFAKLANYVGVAKLCKRFISMLGRLDTQTDKQITFRAGSPAKCIPEKKLIYELFAKANTAKLVRKRKFHHEFIAHILPKLTTKLKDKKLEEQISGVKDDEAYHFLSSIAQILEPEPAEETATPIVIEAVEDKETEKLKRILEKRDELTGNELDTARKVTLAAELALLDDDAGRTNVDLAEDDVEHEDKEELNEGEEENYAGMGELKSNDVSPSSTKNKESTKKDRKMSQALGYNRWMRENVWLAGKKRLEIDDVKTKRLAARRRLEKKMRHKHAIESIALENMESQVFKDEITVDVPCWTSFMMDRYSDYWLRNWRNRLAF